MGKHAETFAKNSMRNTYSQTHDHRGASLEKGACVERVVPVAMSWFYVAMQREPVVMWSCFIGFTGASPPNPASVVSLHSETLPIRKGFCSVRRSSRRVARRGSTVHRL